MSELTDVFLQGLDSAGFESSDFDDCPNRGVSEAKVRTEEEACAAQRGVRRIVSRQQSGGVTHHLFGAAAAVRSTRARWDSGQDRNEGCISCRHTTNQEGRRHLKPVQCGTCDGCHPRWADMYPRPTHDGGLAVVCHTEHGRDEVPVPWGGGAHVFLPRWPLRGWPRSALCAGGGEGEGIPDYAAGVGWRRSAAEHAGGWGCEGGLDGGLQIL